MTLEEAEERIKELEDELEDEASERRKTENKLSLAEVALGNIEEALDNAAGDIRSEIDEIRELVHKAYMEI